MNITFYTTSDPPKKLNKALTPIGTARALTPTSQINVLNPVVVVNYDSTYGDLIVNANYAYIDTFHRYYYVNCGLDTAKRIIVSGSCDVLMSWKDGILNCPSTIVRKQLSKPTYTIDKKLPIDSSRYFIDCTDFDSSSWLGTESYERYVLITR